MNENQIANKVAKMVMGDKMNIKEAAKEEFAVIVEYVMWENTEDDYDKGEIGKSMQVMFEKNVGQFKSVQDAIRHVSKMVGIPEKDFAAFEQGRIEAEGLYDENNSYVGDDKRFMERFKNHEVKAWSGRISMYIKFAKTWAPSVQELKKWGLPVI